MKMVKIDRRGRVVIPRAIRFETRIQTPSKLIVAVEGPGKISLQSIETNLREAQQIGRRKLPGWKEEEHEEDRLASKLADRKGALIHPPMKPPAKVFVRAGRLQKQLSKKQRRPMKSK